MVKPTNKSKKKNKFENQHLAKHCNNNDSSKIY